MLVDVTRFNRRARRSSAGPSSTTLTLEELLADGRWSPRVRQLVPRPARARRSGRPTRRRSLATPPSRSPGSSTTTGSFGLRDQVPVAHHPRRRPPLRGCDRPDARSRACASRRPSTRSCVTTTTSSSTPGRERAGACSITSSSRRTATKRSRCSATRRRGARGARCLPLPAEYGRAAHRRADAPTGAARLGELELPPSDRGPRSRHGDLPHESAPEPGVASRDLRHPQPHRRDRARCRPRDDPVLAPRLRSSSPRGAATSRRDQRPAIAPRTAGRTGATASTRTASRAPAASAPRWECRGEQRDLRGHGLPPTGSSRCTHDFTYRVALPLLDLDEVRRGVLRSILSGRARMPNAVQFRRRDFYGPPEQPLAETRSATSSRNEPASRPDRLGPDARPPPHVGLAVQSDRVLLVLRRRGRPRRPGVRRRRDQHAVARTPRLRLSESSGGALVRQGAPRVAVPLHGPAVPNHGTDPGEHVTVRIESHQ